MASNALTEPIRLSAEDLLLKCKVLFFLIISHPLHHHHHHRPSYKFSPIQKLWFDAPCLQLLYCSRLLKHLGKIKASRRETIRSVCVCVCIKLLHTVNITVCNQCWRKIILQVHLYFLACSPTTLRCLPPDFTAFTKQASASSPLPAKTTLLGAVSETPEDTLFLLQSWSRQMFASACCSKQWLRCLSTKTRFNH